MILLVSTIHVIVCLFLIGVVLLQQGKGADLSVFGGGGSQAAFGARGAATLLHKLTVFGFVAFTLTTMSISLFANSGGAGTVMSGVPSVVEEVAEPAADADAELTEAAAAATDAATDAAAGAVEGAAEAVDEATDDGDGSQE